jgi:hypothetical protein
MTALDLKHTAERELTLEWVASSSNDMIADAALTLIMGIDSSRSSVKSESTRIMILISSRHLLIRFLFPPSVVTSKRHRHSHSHSHSEPEKGGNPTTSSSPSQPKPITIDLERVLPFLTAHFGSAEIVERVPPPKPIASSPTPVAAPIDVKVEEKEGGEASQSQEEVDEEEQKKLEGVLTSSEGEETNKQEKEDDWEEGKARVVLVVKVDEAEVEVDTKTMVRSFGLASSPIFSRS